MPRTVIASRVVWSHVLKFINMKTLLLCCIFATFANVYGNKDFSIIDSIKQEPQCLEKGGICTISEDCPPMNLAEEQGLCPKQRKQGIECCYGLSVKETRCIKNGGICLPATEFCNPDLIVTRATDCESNQKCCVMVH